MRTAASWNSKEMVRSQSLRTFFGLTSDVDNFVDGHQTFKRNFWTDVIWQVVVVGMKSDSAGFALPVKKMIP